MHFSLRPLTAEDGERMAGWSYPGPWSVYDVQGSVAPDEGFWAVVDEAGEVSGYACFGVEARVPGLAERPGTVDVGVAMAPHLVGHGLGRAFAGAVLSHARAAGSGRLRAVVQDWNARSRRLLAGLGFEETGEHLVGQVRYVVYEQEAPSAQGEQPST